MLAYTGGSEPAYATSNDHLVSRAEPRSTNPAYRSYVRRKLTLTPFDCGKITVFPDLGPESSVSIYAKNGKYVATELVAEGQGFWQNWKRRDHLKVSRIDAEIPAAKARAWQHMIRRLLSNVGPSPRHVRRKSEVEEVVAVGKIRLFELDLQTRKTVLSGDVPREPPGPKTQSAESIYQLVCYYCEKPSQRRDLAVQVEREVARVFGPVR